MGAVLDHDCVGVGQRAGSEAVWVSIYYTCQQKVSWPVVKLWECCWLCSSYCMERYQRALDLVESINQDLGANSTSSDSTAIDSISSVYLPSTKGDFLGDYDTCWKWVPPKIISSSLTYIMLDRVIQRRAQQMQFELGLCAGKNPSYSLSLVGRANSCGWRRNVIIKGKTWENGLLRAERMDGECTKIASSISWRYRPTPARWAEES